MITRSLRFHISVIYSVVLFLILACFGTFLYFTVQRILWREFDRDQKFKAQEVVNFLNTYEEITTPQAQPYVILTPRGFYLEPPASLNEKEKAFLISLWQNEFKALNLKKDLLRIVDNHGHVLIQSKNLDPETHHLFDLQLKVTGQAAQFKTVSIHHQTMRVASLPFSYRGPNGQLLFVQIASSFMSQQSFLKEFLFFIILSIAFILAVTSFMGRALTRRVLRPVEQITSTANAISYQDLNTRLTDQPQDIEMLHLVHAFNEMLERLEKSFRHINEFSSHVAHELKTPLAIMRGEIELALKSPASAEEYRRVLDVCHPEVDRLIHIIRDLLLLAKLEFSSEIFHFEKLDLSALVSELCEHAQILGNEKEIQLSSRLPDGPLPIQGDKVHLRRLFLNIIQNAVTHTPAKGTISVSVSVKDHHAHIAIADTGPGIPPKHLKKIFDKFYRVDQIDDSRDLGIGLGLSMALAIAKAHQGDIQVQSDPPHGTTFTVILPVG